jgi:dienelactone hydrolase
MRSAHSEQACDLKNPRQRHSRVAVLGPAILLGVLAGTTVVGCGSENEIRTTSATPAPVMDSERVWVDASRPTNPNGDYAGAPDRTLRTVIWQPATAGALPLFVIAHGFSGLPEDYEAVARTVAEAGFVVAAPAFPLTNRNAPGGYRHAFQDVASQPADVRFVISKLLAANATAGDALQGRIIADEIAVLGHSLGGATATALTRKDCCRDSRVRASVLFAAAPLDLFTNVFGTDSIAAGPPTLILNGTQDLAVSYTSAQLLYAQIDPPKFFVGITGADHTNAIVGHTTPLPPLQSVSARAIVAFLNAQFRGASSGLSSTLATLGAEGNTVQSDGATP